MKIVRAITCVDAHTAGEPLRVITSGFPRIEGDSMLAKQEYVLAHYDHLRKLLIQEPRGHQDMYGCILVPAPTPDGDFGALFLHNEGISSMCGHGILAVAKVVIQTGMIDVHEGENIIKIDTPAGRITAYADVADGNVEQVRFRNQPCFVFLEKIPILLNDRMIEGDVAYGGSFFVYVEASQVGLAIIPDNAHPFIQIGMEIKSKILEKYHFVHPTEPGIDGSFGIVFVDPVTRSGNTLTSKNVFIFADGQLDRSPTGSATGGRVALLVHLGIMHADDILVNQSIIGTSMKARLIERVQVGNYPAVIAEISGTAFITGFNTIILDADDPLPEGFRLKPFQTGGE